MHNRISSQIKRRGKCGTMVIKRTRFSYVFERKFLMKIQFAIRVIRNSALVQSRYLADSKQHPSMANLDRKKFTRLGNGLCFGDVKRRIFFVQLGGGISFGF